MQAMQAGNDPRAQLVPLASMTQIMDSVHTLLHVSCAPPLKARIGDCRQENPVRSRSGCDGHCLRALIAQVRKKLCCFAAVLAALASFFSSSHCKSNRFKRRGGWGAAGDGKSFEFSYYPLEK